MKDNDAMNKVDEAAVAGRGADDKLHPRLLTDAEWARVMPPFYYIKVTFDQWTKMEYDVAVKYILKNGTGWLYFDDKRFIFEKEDDYVLFRLWAENKPMIDDGVLEVT